MGLTGIIYEVTFKLIKIETSLILVNTKRCKNLDELMSEMLENDSKFRYSVAWVDSLNESGRGVITTGEHALLKDLSNSSDIKNELFYDPKAITSAPPIFPGGLLNKFTVGMFNEAWYRKAPMHRENELQTISTYFHPLDGVKNLNKIYGPKGFYNINLLCQTKHPTLLEKHFRLLKKLELQVF